MSAGSQRIGVLCGGPPDPNPLSRPAPPPDAAARLSGAFSPPSMAAGRAVLAALLTRGHDAVLIEMGRDLDVALRALKIQVAFLASRGRTGEDGSVQGLLELLGIPYTGSGVLASALSLDCQKARLVLRQNNLPTPPCYLIWASEEPSDAELAARNEGFGYPAVVRPRHDNPGCLPCAVESDEELVAAVRAVRRFDDDVIVERHGAGRTLAVGILDGNPIAALEFYRDRRSAAVIAREARSAAVIAREARSAAVIAREARSAAVIDPAQLLGAAEDETGSFTVGLSRLSQERLRGVMELSVRASQVLGCSGPTRVDVLVSDRGNEVVLAVNPRPALSPKSLLGRAAQSAGISFDDLVERVLHLARLHGRRPRHAELCGPPLDRRAEDLPGMLYTHGDRRVLPVNVLAREQEVV